MSRLVIDADGHISEPPELWEEFCDPDFLAFAPRRVLDSQGRPRTFVGGEMVPYIPFDSEAYDKERPKGGVDPHARLADMDSEGMDISVIFPTTGLMFGGIADAAVNNALCRAYNDWLRTYCNTDTSRLLGVAVVPQVDPALMLAEARRAIDELGFVAVMLRPNVIAGRTLDHPAYDGLWSLLADRGVPAALHEGTTQNVPQSGLDRYDNFMFRHVCSHPHEQQMGCLELIAGGVLERHPDLRVVFLESGCGWVDHWLERIDEHLDSWGHASAPLELNATEYFQRQCFISCDPEERTVPGVMDSLGDDCVVFATDYPHPDGVFPGVVKALSDREDLSEDRKDKILGLNAKRCFGL
ncbi:amidohydrolase family protein [Candidatus Poriferisocius sp.]|uniref:amidohydrolase family protein n=1 Tax=Candidatus Poriferisocius sp. TaxID=3101276 RepID=UPI003B5A3465